MRAQSALFLIGVGSMYVGVGVGIALLCGPARAQEEPKPSRPTVFSRLFAQPSGANGYEDWVQACDVIQGNKEVYAATEPLPTTLTLKRRLMADPQIQKALQLVRDGLNKPSVSPHQLPDDATVYPELSLFRQLARLLNTQMEVYFANGRVDAAIDVLSDGLRFGYRVQTDTVISGLVGVSIETIVLKGFSAHLDMLSEYQCGRVQRLMEECLEWPSPTAALLNGNRQESLRSLENKRSDLKGLEELLQHSSSGDEHEQADAQNLLDYLELHPLELGQAIDQAKGLIAAHYDAVAANLKRPVKERLPMNKANVKSLGGTLFSLVTLDIGTVVERYDRINAMIRLLGVHAAARRYRWEHNSLPNSLSQLRLGALAVDPFTGESLRYQRSGADYDLFSQGPQETNAAGIPTGKRAPVRL